MEVFDAAQIVLCSTTINGNHTNVDQTVAKPWRIPIQNVYPCVIGIAHMYAPLPTKCFNSMESDHISAQGQLKELRWQRRRDVILVKGLPQRAWDGGIYQPFLENYWINNQIYISIYIMCIYKYVCIYIYAYSTHKMYIVYTYNIM